MSLIVTLVFSSTLAAGQPVRLPPQPDTATVAAQERAPVRCRPAPYLVAEQDETARERILITGSRVPVVSRDIPDRRPRPCMLMRDGDPRPNPLRVAD